MRRLIGIAVAAAVLITPVVAALPASAETYGEYVQNCERWGSEQSPYVSGLTIPTTSLSEGSSGDCVKYLQFLLDGKGWSFNGGRPYELTIDGQFGPLTNSAVLSFQAGMGIQRDGIAGPQTWSYLGTLD